MKSSTFLFLISILTSFSTSAQTVKIIDNTNLQPLPNVLIYSKNPSVSATTNQNGEAELTLFKNADSIWISHMSYGIKTYNYSQLSTLNFKIILSEKIVSMDEVVVSASRFEEKMQDVAQPIQVIKAKDLSFMNQPTTADVMQNSGNVFVQKSQMGGGSPIIRGFETNKVLMVVDGIRMNNAIYRSGHLQNIITLDNAMMDKVEIVFGPGSVVYGSDALGGVMHFYSKNPILADSTGIKLKINAFSRYSTAYNEKTGHVDFSIANKKFGSISSITYADFGDLRQGNNRNPFYGDWGKRNFYVEQINGKDSVIQNNNVNIQKQSGYKQYDILQKFLFEQNKKITHVVNLQYSTSSDIPRYDRLTQVKNGLPRYAEWYYGPQTRLATSYSLNLKNDVGFYDNARIILGYQYVEESRHDRQLNKTAKNNRTESLDILTFNADFAKKINKQEIRYGMEGWNNNVISKANQEDILTGEKKPLDTRYPDGGSSMSSAAAYLTHTFEINEKIILNDGIRINYVRLNAQFNDTTFFPFPFKEVTQSNTAVNGNIGLIYMPGYEWRFSIVGSSGFRAPNVDDLSKVFESVSGSVVLPNPNIRPEYTYNIDLGISKTFYKSITIGTAVFYMWYRDAITTKTGKFNGQDSIFFDGKLSQVTMSLNTSKAYITGFNAYFNADITEHFSFTNTLNFTFGRIQTDSLDFPLDHIPPVFGKSSFNLKLNKFRGEFFVMFNGEKKSKDYNLLGEDNHTESADPINGYMPMWMTLNVRAAYQFNTLMRIQASLENILDKNYRVFASNIGAPGRNFVVSLNVRF